MSEQWFVFKMYGLDELPMLAEYCLKSIEHLDIRAQLRQQRIWRIRWEPGHEFGGIQLYSDPHLGIGFEIVLDVSGSLDDNVKTVVHEIGHTFEACYFGNFFERGLLKLFSFNSKEHFELSEKFANTFEKKWLENAKNRAGVTNLLSGRPQRTRITI